MSLSVITAIRIAWCLVPAIPFRHILSLYLFFSFKLFAGQDTEKIFSLDRSEDELFQTYWFPGKPSGYVMVYWFKIKRMHQYTLNVLKDLSEAAYFLKLYLNELIEIQNFTEVLKTILWRPYFEPHIIFA